MTIGDRIRYYRELKGLTQEQLAERLNVRPQTIYKYEKSVVRVPLDRVKQLAVALEVKPVDLVDWWEEQEIDDLRDSIKDNPKLRMLLSASAKLNMDDIDQLIRLAVLMDKDNE